MAQASTPDNYIYEGVWINWTRGSPFGLTLTLNPKHASILSPALAILISIAGVQLWSLVQISLHQIRATPKARPMIYHQTQVVLRNSTTDLSTLWQLIRIGFAWKQIVPILGLLLWTIIHLILVLMFGLLSSTLLESNDEVLSRSPWCGTFNTTYIKTIYSTTISGAERTRMVTEYNQHLYYRYAFVQQHVDICERSSNGCSVNPYRPSALKWTSSYIAGTCPFNVSLCNPSAGTINMDTGLLSSHSDFGFNAADEDRVSFRMFARCSPLDDASHTSVWQNVSTIEGTRQLADASYGRSAFNSRNSTYSLWWKPLNCEQRLTMAPYILMPYFAAPGTSVAKSTATFDPITELQLPDADVSLMLLAYHDAYLTPVSDPWYSARATTNDTKLYCGRNNGTVYVRERPLTALACTQQWQVCSKDKNAVGEDSCTRPLAIPQLIALLGSPAPGITLNARQLAISQRLLDAAIKSTFFNMVQALSPTGSLPLKARSQLLSIAGALSPAVASDQWQIEARYWMDLVLGYLQQINLDYSTGQFAAATSYINVSTPSTVADKIQDGRYWLCQAQIIHSTAYRNFNFCALLATTVVCAAVIILGLSIEDCVACWRIRRQKYTGPRGGSKQDMWTANTDLHMLRMIDELKKKTRWTLSKNGVPRTHPSYEVSINDFLIDNGDAEKGNPVIHTAASNFKLSRSKANITLGRQERDNLGDVGVSLVNLPPWHGESGGSIYNISNDDINASNHNGIWKPHHPYSDQAAPHVSDEFDANSYNVRSFSNSIPSSIDEHQHMKSSYSKARPVYEHSSFPESMKVRMKVDEIVQGISLTPRYNKLSGI